MATEKTARGIECHENTKEKCVWSSMVVARRQRVYGHREEGMQYIILYKHKGKALTEHLPKMTVPQRQKVYGQGEGVQHRLL